MGMNPASYASRPPARMSRYVVVKLRNGTHAAVHRAGWRAVGTYVSSHRTAAMAAWHRDRLNALAPTGPLDPATGDARDTSVDYARQAWG